VRAFSTRLGYRLIRLLGQGGMGVVYLALREAAGAEVAVKTVTPALAGRDAPVRRFLREAEVLKQFDHPNIIVWFFDVGAGGRGDLWNRPLELLAAVATVVQTAHREVPWVGAASIT
jgi:serine/threonine protein kinase